MRHLTALLLTLAMPVATALAQPFGGTVYAEPDIITSNDPSTLSSFTYVGMEEVEAFDHRIEDWAYISAFAFSALYRDGQEVAFYVNAEFESQRQARFAGNRYAHVLGQMPRLLRDGVAQVIVHETGDDWSASPGEITIHDGAVEQEAADGALEESMIHETVHTSLDYRFEETSAWRAAQRKDGAFISDYARENPNREDFAESFTLYLGLVISPERMDADVIADVRATIPARLRYFEATFPAHTLGL